MSRLFVNKFKCIVVQSVKKYSTPCIYKDVFTVSQFCNLKANLPFSIKIRPLDVHAYRNSDKLIIKIFSNNLTNKPHIHCIQDNENFHISTESEYAENTHCYIEAPVKSDLNIKAARKGSIDIKKFKGNNIFLETESGDIASESCQTSKIHFKSRNGNITTLGTLHAAEILLKTGENACIDVNHLQALNACVTTEDGDIRVKSSYCDETEFHTKTGKLILDNVHKQCSICIAENGSLHMTGFNGTLIADIRNGDADIQMSKVYDSSTINIQDKNVLLLRLSEWIQENTKINAICQQLKLADNVKLVLKNTGSSAVLVPENNENTSEIIINSKLSCVCIEEASWLDMLKLKGIHFNNE